MRKEKWDIIAGVEEAFSSANERFHYVEGLTKEYGRPTFKSFKTGSLICFSNWEDAEELTGAQRYVRYSEVEK